MMNKKLWIALGFVFGAVHFCGGMAFEEDAPEETDLQRMERFAKDKYGSAMPQPLFEAMNATWAALNSGDNNKFITALHEYDNIYNKVLSGAENTEHKVFVESTDSEGYTPFLRAVKNGNKDIVELLLGRSGTDVQASVSGQNALNIIAQELAGNPKEEIKKAYIELIPLLINANVPLSKEFLKSENIQELIPKDKDIQNALVSAFKQVPKAIDLPKGEVREESVFDFIGNQILQNAGTVHEKELIRNFVTYADLYARAFQQATARPETAVESSRVFQASKKQKEQPIRIQPDLLEKLLRIPAFAQAARENEAIKKTVTEIFGFVKGRQFLFGGVKK